jgi:hypothetical protein
MKPNLLVDGLPIIMIDASALKLSSCRRRLLMKAICGLGQRQEKPSCAIEYGVAFHKFAAAFHSGVEPFAATSLAVDHHKAKFPDGVGKDYRTTDHLSSVCVQYALKYKFDNFKLLQDNNGKWLTEQRFAIQFNDHSLAHRFHVLLVGTIDALGTLNGEPAFCDHKTTSVWNKEDYLSAYYLSPQMLFYRMVMDLYADKYPNLKPFKGCGCFINGVFLNKTSGADYVRGDLMVYNDEQVARFNEAFVDQLENLLLDVSNLYDGIVPPADGIVHDVCNSHFGKCEYFQACSSPREESFHDWVDFNCKSEPYDPRKFGA